MRPARSVFVGVVAAWCLAGALRAQAVASEVHVIVEDQAALAALVALDLDLIMPTSSRTTRPD
jgi:hypothetical protein